MKKLYYFFRYSLIIMIGVAIKYIGVPSIYDMPFIVPILYNFLAIRFGIIHPLEVRKDIKYKDIRNSMMFLTSTLNIVLMYLSYVNVSYAILFIFINIIILLFSKPKYEKIDEETQKYIDDYFNNKDK